MFMNTLPLSRLNEIIQRYCYLEMTKTNVNVIVFPSKRTYKIIKRTYEIIQRNKECKLIFYNCLTLYIFMYLYNRFKTSQCILK